MCCSSSSHGLDREPHLREVPPTREGVVVRERMIASSNTPRREHVAPERDRLDPREPLAIAAAVHAVLLQRPEVVRTVGVETADHHVAAGLLSPDRDGDHGIDVPFRAELDGQSGEHCEPADELLLERRPATAEPSGNDANQRSSSRLRRARGLVEEIRVVAHARYRRLGIALR